MLKCMVSVANSYINIAKRNQSVSVNNLKQANKGKSKMITLFEFLLYLFTFFPYTIIFNSSTDLQIYCLLIAFMSISIFVVRNTIKLNTDSLVLFFVLCVASVLSLKSGVRFEALRSLANYCSLFFISMAFYNFIERYGFNEKYCKIFICIWFIVGATQVFINKNFMSFSLSQARTTEGRGVFGLANEPSFYGITMALMLLVVEKFRTNKRRYFVIVVVQVMLFAQSATGIIAMIIILIMLLLGNVKINIKTVLRILILIAIMLLGIYLYYLLYPEKRLSRLILAFLEGKILTDVSVYDRMAAIIDSFTVFITNHGIPNGFKSRIMSGFGAVLAELGIFGIPLIIVVCKSVVKGFKYKRFQVINAILFFLLMLMAIQLAHPLIAMVVGIGMQYAFGHDKMWQKHRYSLRVRTVA